MKSIAIQATDKEGVIADFNVKPIYSSTTKISIEVLREALKWVWTDNRIDDRL